MEYEVKVTEKSIYIGNSPAEAIAAIDYYVNRRGFIVATHTEVSKDYRGKGLAGILFKRLIDLAKEKETTIIPYCSYISEMLDKPEYNIYLHQ